MEKPLKFLGIDFETQDADAKTTRATEVGAVLYEYRPSSYLVPAGTEITEENKHQFQKLPQLVKLKEYNAFCYEPDYPAQTEKIVQLTGITDEMLQEKGRPRKEVWGELLPLVEEADVIFAHKISFDRTVLKSTAALFNLVVPVKEWVCTLTNFPWPSHLTCHKLSHLAYEHSILVDPTTLHRAVNDVDLMMRLISEKYDLSQVLAYARTPWIYVKADILGPWVGRGGDGGVQSGIAKELGFAWEQVKGVDEYRWPKTWVRRIKDLPGAFEKLRAAGASSASPFRISRIEGLS